MKDLGTLRGHHKDISFFIGKCFYVLFSSNGAKFRQRFEMYSHSIATLGRASKNPLVML
jgi:hypothetical protein